MITYLGSWTLPPQSSQSEIIAGVIKIAKFHGFPWKEKDCSIDTKVNGGNIILHASFTTVARPEELWDRFDSDVKAYIVTGEFPKESPRYNR
ncbi:MAG TPA: hypothetical protein VJB12_02080 [Candidatus Nanoarchaeia archaeon]|nr:hypothetical protein [Candidatus Nanoarchaeia archaeon]